MLNGYDVILYTIQHFFISRQPGMSVSWLFFHLLNEILSVYSEWKVDYSKKENNLFKVDRSFL